MADPRLLEFRIPLEVDTSHFNLAFSADGAGWTGYDYASASPTVPRDIVVSALDTNHDYLLDGVNSPGGNEAAASVGPWYRLRLKNASGYGNWSLPFPIGWPCPDDVLARLHSALRVPSGDTLPAYVTDPIGAFLAATIDGVESPIGEGGAGGTGRSFTRTNDTRTYDGTGLAVLEIDDLVPDTTYAVTLNGTTLTDARLLPPRWLWEGSRYLARPNATAYGLPGLWTAGYGNVEVSGIFGYDATVPTDLWEAVAGEAARRAILQGNNDLAGVGETVSMGSFSITTSSGISVWADSSVLAMWQKDFKSAIQQFRRRHSEPFGRGGW